jgi:hypothetical protein
MALLSGISVFWRQPSSALEHLQQSDLSLPMPTLLLPCLALLFLPLRPPHICIQHVHFYVVVVIRTTARFVACHFLVCYIRTFCIIQFHIFLITLTFSFLDRRHGTGRGWPKLAVFFGLVSSFEYFLFFFLIISVVSF